MVSILKAFQNVLPGAITQVKELSHSNFCHLSRSLILVLVLMKSEMKELLLPQHLPYLLSAV